MSEAAHRQQLDRVRERFTRTAGEFADFSLSVRSAEAERLAALAVPQAAEIALDLACGPGTFARAFAPRVRWMCGMDLTPALLARARQAADAAGAANLRFVCGNAYALPFATDAFDLASCGYSLHHMDEPAAALAELARVVRRGGRIAVLDLIAPEESARAEANNRIERARDRSHCTTLAASDIVSLVKAAGFRVTRREIDERRRSFDDWMRIGGLKAGDAAYEETRRLMEAAIEPDAAGFHPRLVPADEAGTPQDAPAGAPELQFVQTSLFIVAERK